MPFYRFGEPGQDSCAHINFGRKKSIPDHCAAPRFPEDNQQIGETCRRVATALCDGPADNESRPSAITCDKPICALHCTPHQTKPNTDYCPEHKELAK